MLFLTRRIGEETLIGGNAAGEHTLFDAQGNPVEITVTVLGLQGYHRNQVRIGITAPRNIPVNRAEIDQRVRREMHDLVDGNVT